MKFGKPVLVGVMTLSPIQSDAPPQSVAAMAAMLFAFPRRVVEIVLWRRRLPVASP